MFRHIKYLLLGVYSLISGCSHGQAPPHVSVENDRFHHKLESLLSFTTPLIGVQELAKHRDEYLIFDVREKEEYDVSHIEGAKFMGYKKPNFDLLEGVEKDRPIVVYCSVGYRSEKLGEKLKKRGFTNVKNLYGSIFEWKNEGFPVVDNENQPTDKVHTYNKRWSKWVEDGKAEKVW